ncbi:MAG TPA: DNA glycosylase [Opitutus sp.]|nr:DNA glycosylase [Opitutus sp.]
MTAIAWSAPRPLGLFPPPAPAVLAEILDGGQAFRWHRTGGGATPSSRTDWLGTFDRFAVRLSFDFPSALLWSAPAASTDATAAALVHYFDLGRDFAALADRLPWRSDAHLATCLAAFPGLRILRQPFGETLLGFLCSATKQIVQIKQMLALLAARHGELLPGCRAGSPDPAKSAVPRLPAGSGDSALHSHRLPTWPELAAIPESDLRACLLGFRARYIHQVAQFLAAHPGWLEETESLPYAAAKERLCSLPGVGEKVADCVLLFGAGKLEAFPVDTWIIRALSDRYGLAGWKPAQIAHFGRTHFGPLAGLAQQYLFAFERRLARTAPPAIVI